MQPVRAKVSRRNLLSAGAGLATAGLALGGCAETLQLTQDRATAIRSVLPVVSFDETLQLEYSTAPIMIGVMPPMRIMHAQQLVATDWGMNLHAAAAIGTAMGTGRTVLPAVTVTPGLVPREGATTRLPQAMIQQRLAALPAVAAARQDGKADAVLLVATIMRNGLPHRNMTRAVTYGATLITVDRVILEPQAADFSLAYLVQLYDAQKLELLASVVPDMNENQGNMFGTPVPRRTVPIVWRGENWNAAREPQRSMLRDAAFGVLSETLPSALSTMGLLAAAPRT